jgi:ABC-type multidrug transport system ATPase subunit
MFCTLLPPTSGSASVARHDVVADGDAVRRDIGAAGSLTGSSSASV